VGVLDLKTLRHEMANLVDDVFAPHVTFAVAVPGSVLVPILQLHLTFPAELDVARPRPLDSLT
jgi:hypothetical protein